MVINKERHFVITMVSKDEEQNVSACMIEAVMTKNEYPLNWRDLKDSQQWKIGWQ